MNNTSKLIALEKSLLNKVVRSTKDIVDVGCNELVKKDEVVKVIKVEATEIGNQYFKLTARIARFENEDSEIVLIARDPIVQFIAYCNNLFTRVTA